MAVRPISPKEAMDQKFIPDEVIEAFNELIMEKITLKRIAVVIEDEVIERTKNIMRKQLAHVSNREIYFDMKWLDIEDMYENNGWVVTYNKPTYNASFTPRFIFRPK